MGFKITVGKKNAVRNIPYASSDVESLVICQIGFKTTRPRRLYKVFVEFLLRFEWAGKVVRNANAPDGSS
jgi:hypothetical protein